MTKIYAKTIEKEAIDQIEKMAKSPLGKNAHIRIMPDCHAGAGCVIGTTMYITDKVCPNLVGVDIGCGVDYVETNIDFSTRLEELDAVIRENIPCGMNVHNEVQPYDFTQLRCWDKLKRDTQELAMHSLGTLGGGNHFIEAYDNCGLAVHSGSRNIGWRVAEYYQKLAEKKCFFEHRQKLMEEMKAIEPRLRSEWLKQNKVEIDKELSFLTGQDMEDYLHDVAIMQKFANDNRKRMLDVIVSKMGGKILEHINSIHN